MNKVIKTITVAGLLTGLLAGAMAGCGTSSVRGNGSGEESTKAMSSSKSQSGAEKTSSPGKPALPIQVDASLGEGRGSLTLTASSPVEQLKVEVWGTRGAEVQAEVSTVAGRKLSSGESVQVDLSWRGGAEGDVAVRVTGLSNGREQSVVRSFSLSPNRTLESEKAGEVRVDSEGRKVKVMPSN